MAGSINQNFNDIFGEALTPREENIKNFSEKVEFMLKQCLKEGVNWTEIEGILEEIEQWDLN